MTNFVKNLTDEERAILISVPYRIGVWIGNSDDNTKTQLDDKREAQALEHAIKRYARAGKKMPFISYIMSHTENSQASWSAWAQNSQDDAVFNDLEAALAICNKSDKPIYLKQYRRLIWQIATIVAQAHNENRDPDNEMHVDRFFAWIGTYFGPPKIKKVPENMSSKEKSALQKLRAVLKR